MRLPSLSLVSIFIVLSAVSCNKSGGPSDDAFASSTEGTEGDDTPDAAVGVVALITPDKALAYVQTALTSTADISTEISATKAGTIAIALTDSSDPDCYDGSPKNLAEKVFLSPGEGARAGEVNERAPYYASGLWYCHLKNIIPHAFDLPSAFA